MAAAVLAGTRACPMMAPVAQPLGGGSRRRYARVHAREFTCLMANGSCFERMRRQDHGGRCARPACRQPDG